jgi:putative ABC transport system permease protein
MPSLILNFFKILVRSIRKNLLIAVLNFSGLVIGIFCLTFISLYVFNELSYDRHIPNFRNIYRATLHWSSQADNEQLELSWALSTLTRQLLDYCPEVESATGVTKFKKRATVRIGAKIFREDNFYETDTSFFKVFKLPLISGRLIPSNSKSSIVLTESIARKYFGKEDPINQILLVNGTQYQVAGILGDVPLNSSLRYEALTFTHDPTVNEWCYVFFTMVNHSDIKQVQKKIDDLFHEENDEYLKKSHSTGSYEVEKLTDIHIGKAKLFDAPKVEKQILFILTSIAIIVMLVSCVNYVNINIAVASSRQIEMGIRKIFGSTDRQIRLQFILELAFLSFLCLCISIILVLLINQYFKSIGLFTIESDVNNIVNISFFGIVCISLLSIISGSYISQQINRSSLVENIKKQGGFIGKKAFRNGMLVFQFSVSIGLAFAAIVIGKQTVLISGNGDKSNISEVMVIEVPREEGSAHSLDEFANSIKQLPFVQVVSFTGYRSLPTIEPDYELFRLDLSGQVKFKTFPYVSVDENFFKLMNIPIIQGRNFKEGDFDNVDSKWENPIVNESFVKNQQWDNDPLQHKIFYASQEDGSEIIGVVNDFGYNGFSKEAKPIVFYPNKEFPENILIRLSGLDKAKIDKIKDIWMHSMKLPMEFKFLNDYFLQTIQKEKDLQYLLICFSIMSCVITSLGLFGLINISLSKSKKEIGVRRILGANVFDLLKVVWKEYLLLFLVSIILAYPISTILLKKWLENFAQRISISIDIYLLALFVVAILLAIAFIYHAVQVIKSDSLKWIKNEN